MTRALSSRSAWLFVALFVVGAVPVLAQPHAQTLDGRAVEPLGQAADVPATVLIFTATDCPISNRYAPEVKRIFERFGAAGALDPAGRVRFYLVYANPHDEPDAIRAHIAKFGYAMQALRDPDHELVRFARVTVSPEVAVFDREGREVYRGRIDDRFAGVGLDRQTPTRHDLQEALSAVLEGRPVPTPVTQAFGCVLADFRP